MTTKCFLAATLASLLLIGACENKSTIDKAEDKFNDALDRRLAEEIRDAAEDVGAAAKDIGRAGNDAAKDVVRNTKAAALITAEDAKEAVR